MLFDLYLMVVVQFKLTFFSPSVLLRHEGKIGNKSWQNRIKISIHKNDTYEYLLFA
jgi:hypothetical protein